MLIFILSFIATAIISLCFFKSKFWENRYLVLLIGSGVALVATLTTNYIARGHFQKKTEIVWTKPLYKFYLPDSIFLSTIKYVDVRDSLGYDSLGTTKTQISFINNYKWYSKHSANEFYRDTTKWQHPVSFVMFADDKKGKNRYIGTFKSKYKQDFYDYDNCYLASSGNDTIGYVTKKKLVYTVPPSNWITGFSFPRVETATVIYLPAKEFALIPDSLIKKLPF